MINKINELGYKRISEFKSKKTRDSLNLFIKNRIRPNNCAYYAKIVQQTLIYDMENGDSFHNDIQLNIFFLLNEQESDIIDCFCVPAYPFDFRTQEDMNTFISLFNIYRNDLQTLMEEMKCDHLA